MFFFGILDSLPLPIFAGSDILTAILAASHRNPWYELLAAVATNGFADWGICHAQIGTPSGYCIFAQQVWKQSRSGHHRNTRWGTLALIVSTIIPLFPASVFFAAAGASGYGTRKYFIVVGVCRVVRYSLVAILADHYGRQVISVLRHPDQHWNWLLLIAATVAGVVAIGILVDKRLQTHASTD